MRLTTGKTTPETIKLYGGALCLDFANTVDWSEDGEPLGSDTDALTEPDAPARWGRRLGLVVADEEPRHGARGEPGHGAGDELAAARGLRAALYAIFAGIADGRTPPAAALERLARDHAEAAAAAHLAPDAGVWRLAWGRADQRAVRYAVAADAVALLADPARLARVHRCPGRNCGWLFLDTSGRRRWCSMRTCGSRAKMRRLYERRTRSSSGRADSTTGPSGPTSTSSSSRTPPTPVR